MSSTPRVIGTLVVVVLKANHLPNKRHIGKQDPYCLVTVNGEKRRTKAIRRGGQHPEWDEEIRFSLYEDEETATNGRVESTLPPPPPKGNQRARRIKGGTTMKLACYADDAREPVLIGEADVDLTEVLTRGETDEWFSLTNKDKFAGKVYLELTFWSNEAPPEKKSASKSDKQYGGPGSFVPSGEQPSPSSHGVKPVARAASVNGTYLPSLESIPSSLRASNSRVDLYIPPYEHRQPPSAVDRLAHELNEFGMSDSRRRESFPPMYAGSPSRPPSSVGFSVSSHSSFNYDNATPASYTYDQPPVIGQDPLVQQNANATNHAALPSHPPIQQLYEPGAPPYVPSPSGPRHSVPASSGFIPLSSSSGLLPVVETTSYPPPSAQTPAPVNYGVDQYSPGSYGVSHSSVSNNSLVQIPPSTSAPFPQPFHSSQTFGYSQHMIMPSVSAPHILHQPYVAAQASISDSNLLGHVSLPNGYQIQSHDRASTPLNTSVNGGSRPLPPQPQVIYAPHVSPPLLSPPANNAPQPVTYAQPQPSAYNSIPPPPPLAADQTQTPYNPNNHPMSRGDGLISVGPPSLPPTLTPGFGPARRRHASLPQPPVSYHLSQHTLPPPPLPPLEYRTHIVPHNQAFPVASASQNQIYHPGPPPKPPGQLDGQWIHALQHN